MNVRPLVAPLEFGKADRRAASGRAKRSSAKLTMSVTWHQWRRRRCAQRGSARPTPKHPVRRGCEALPLRHRNSTAQKSFKISHFSNRRKMTVEHHGGAPRRHRVPSLRRGQREIGIGSPQSNRMFYPGGLSRHGCWFGDYGGRTGDLRSAPFRQIRVQDKATPRVTTLCRDIERPVLGANRPVAGYQRRSSSQSKRPRDRMAYRSFDHGCAELGRQCAFHRDSRLNRPALYPRYRWIDPI